ncbi:DNA/RNA non-specific endonuclease [Streptomyces sp. NPDC057908]|uniref:DNA/RNA non-specific endonuclease n=1 Tax=Streptomyces sp. NPDC057908 TaxID=3346276 RepID=UPI0036E3D79A
MTAPSSRTAARRRRTLPRILHLVLMALLAPIVAAGAQTITATDAVAVTVQAGALAPVPLAAPRGFEAALATLLVEINDANRQAAKLAQQEKAVVAEAERITKESAAIRDSKTALNSKVAAVNQEISGHNKRAKALHGKIAAHNAKPNRFKLPAQAAAANAYDAEARQLEAEKNKENAVEDKIQGEESQIKQKASQVDARSSRLDAASKANDTKADGLRTKAQQLQSQSKQLLTQMAQVIQSFASAPSNPAAAMDQGGDAPAPAPQAGNRSVSQDEDTGDTPYRQPRASALKQYAKQNGTTVDARPGTAYLTPDAVSGLPTAQAAQLGSPVGTYDGLARKPNGHYRALRVQTPGASGSPEQAAFDEAIARGGQAQASVGGTRITIDEVTSVAAVRIPSEPAPGTPSPSRKQDCGAGYVTYKDTDAAHGNRAQGIDACLTKEYLSSHGGTPTGSVLPPGYRWAQDFAKRKGLRAKTNINNCHLLGNKLSGSGTDRRNLATCSRGANAKQRGSGQGDDHMYSFEKQVYDAVMSDQDVRYTVTPVYDGPRTVPSGFILSVHGSYPDGTAGINLSPPRIPNTLITGDNIGTQSENDAPAPTGSTP